MSRGVHVLKKGMLATTLGAIIVTGQGERGDTNIICSGQCIYIWCCAMKVVIDSLKVEVGLDMLTI